MKRYSRFVPVLAGALAIVTLMGSSPQVHAQCHKGYGYGYGGYAYAGHGQQFYQDWSYSPSLKGYYCYYHFKPHAGYQGYLKHICVSYPDRYPGKVFFFDPAQRVYYGFADLQTQKFNLFDASDRKGTITDIPATALAAPGAVAPKLGELPVGGTAPAAIAPPQVKDEPKVDGPAGLPAAVPQKIEGPARPLIDDLLKPSEPAPKPETGPAPLEPDIEKAKETPAPADIEPMKAPEPPDSTFPLPISK